MEGGINLLQNIPEIEPSSYMKRIELHSPNITASLNGKLGFFYEVGGANGIDAKARKNIEELLPIHYSTRIENKKQLQDEFQIIVAADGYRYGGRWWDSKQRVAGIRERTPSLRKVVMAAYAGSDESLEVAPDTVRYSEASSM